MIYIAFDFSCLVSGLSEFSNVLYEYVDIDDGVLIKFYEPNKAYEHWDEIKY